MLINTTTPSQKSEAPRHTWVYDVLLILVLGIATILHVIGLNWDENQHLHPDERFLTMVESALEPTYKPSEQLGAPPTMNNQQWRQAAIDQTSTLNHLLYGSSQTYGDVLKDCAAWGGYFDTSCSPLNPNNRGYTFYVYGTLPIFIVRYAAEALGQTGYDEVFLVGRQFSAIANILTILILYFIASRLYGRKVGLLAAAFTAFTVMLIQQSHFFTVDSFTNVFMFLAIYFAVRIATEARPLFWDNNASDAPTLEGRLTNFFKALGADPYFWNSLGFGVALGLAMASKINAAVLAIVLPGAFLIRYLNAPQPAPSDPADEVPAPAARPRTFEDFVLSAMLYLILGALCTFIAFRIGQPYAFVGPGFFGIQPNPQWIKTLNDLRAQTSGDVDFPPALQWARRSHLFSLANMIQWGFGWPLGLLAWAGMAYMAWRILKGEYKQHILLWGWTMFYFVWQSLQWNSTMRYQLPSYPLLALVAAWFVVTLAGLKVSTFKRGNSEGSVISLKPFAWILGSTVLILTAAWAVAFASTYTRPQPRVEATHWIYNNIPGPITINLTTAEGAARNHPLPFPNGYSITAGQPYLTTFIAPADGVVDSITLPRVAGRPQGATRALELLIATQPDSGVLGATQFTATTRLGSQPNPQDTPMNAPVNLMPLQTYYLIIRLLDAEGEVDACAPVSLALITSSGEQLQELTPPANCHIRPNEMYVASFTAMEDSRVTAISFTDIFNTAVIAGEQTLTLTARNGAGDRELGSVSVTRDFTPKTDLRGEMQVFKFTQPFSVTKGEGYQVQLAVDGAGAVTLSSLGPINETSWDDGLPLRMDGYDGYGGIYAGGLNLEMYWDDTPDKYQRFVSNLDNGDYIFISSNRQWGTTVRVPERYPLTTAYYRNLLGCPVDMDILRCYAIAEPGMFTGKLGFELVQTFQNYPSLFGFEINDQLADEAFTVYDHPKVLIFKKTDSYDPQAVRAILGAVDLTKVIRLTPRQAGSYPADLQLPLERLAGQRAGGTWSELFSYDALINKYPYVGLVVWYLFIFALGLVTYPILRLALPGLRDRGYPLSRTAGLVIWAWMAWFASSYGVPYTRGMIGLMLGVIAAAGIILGYLQRGELRAEWTSERRRFVITELVFLAFFLIDLGIRLANPDLWHPWKGGERPMDFSYFNAVIKSTTFPPYDPWFAGGYINYYYYGYVIVGTPVKFLGVVPSIAYNFLLPTLFSLLASGAFSVAWNLMDGGPKTEDEGRKALFDHRPLIAGLAAATGMVLLGNLGVPRMIIRGWQQLASGGIAIEDGTLFQRITWLFKGLAMQLGGTPLPYRIGDWYWYPSRIVPSQGGNEITEFPLFTFVYSDLHAHMIAMPIALLIVAWVISMLHGQARWKNLFAAALSIALGGLFIGALRPTNTWDFYTYLVLGALATGYALWRFGKQDWLGTALPAASEKLLLAVIGVGALVGLSLAFYQPFAQWFGQGYNAVERWQNSITPIGSYLSHWGLFLFVIVSWMAWETREWMAHTPISALNKLKPHALWIELALALLIAAIAATFILGLEIGWIVLPLAAWALILILRPNQPDLKRGVLFLIGTALVLTLVVEVIVLKGDIGRQNTIFKFYIQAWLLFAVSAAAALGWLWDEFEKWTFNWRALWQFTMMFLVAGALMFTVIGTFDKIRDRWNPDSPHTLDSMAYMPTVKFNEKGVELELAEDYRAIRWMQDNVQGSPVIVEANSFELYRWYSRFTVYTGLPGVVGWDWHQRQQRALTPGNWVSDRVNAIIDFYNSVDEAETVAFLKKYDVSYIIVGRLEHTAYPGPGIQKFSLLEGKYWKEVYRDGQTAIYEVIR